MPFIETAPLTGVEIVRSNRIGRFVVSNVLFDRDDRLRALAGILAGLVVLRAERLWEKDVTEYVAWGPVFDEVPAGASAPMYLVVITLHADDSSTHRWERVGATS